MLLSVMSGENWGAMALRVYAPINLYRRIEKAMEDCRLLFVELTV